MKTTAIHIAGRVMEKGVSNTLLVGTWRVLVVLGNRVANATKLKWNALQVEFKIIGTKKWDKVFWIFRVFYISCFNLTSPPSSQELQAHIVGPRQTVPLFIRHGRRHWPRPCLLPALTTLCAPTPDTLGGWGWCSTFSLVSRLPTQPTQPSLHTAASGALENMDTIMTSSLSCS